MRLAFVGFILIFAATFASAATNDLSRALQKGLFEEEANHNLDAAAQAYQSVATQFDKDRKLAATAIFRLGEVYRKQGKTNEASAQYERILKEFSDQSELTNLSRKFVTKETAPETEVIDVLPFSLELKEIQRIKAMIKDSPDLINAFGQTASGQNGIPLHVAAQNDWTRVAEFLLANGADVNRGRSSGDTTTALHSAVSQGHKNMVELLLAKGADTEDRDNSGGTALHIASQKGFKAIAEILLKNKSDVNAKNSVMNLGQTPLHFAAKVGHRAVVETLLANGANVNVRDNEDRTPLYVGVDAKNLDMAKFLIGQKADVNAATKEGWTALHLAIHKQEPRLVELLIQNGADVEVKLPKYQQLSGSSEYRDVAPLHMAALLGRVEIVEMLLGAKANPNPTNHYGATPLHHAAGNGSVEVADLLLKNGALIDFADSSGSSPLFWAIGAQKVMTEFLLTNKADPNLLNKSGDTPLSWVKKINNPAGEEITALLLKYGASQNFERLTRISTTRDGKENPFFRKGNQPLNRYNLFELLLWGSSSVHFPDLKNVKIHRLQQSKSQIIPVNVEEILKSGECGENPWLEWGDVVEVPEMDHLINEVWNGLPKEYSETMRKCLERKISITVKGETTNLLLTAYEFRLRNVVGSHLRASSDKTRIKVKRVDPVTKQSHEIIVNVEKPQEPDLWLLDGDAIEIPERDPNAPPAASDNSQGVRTIPTRTLQLAPNPNSPVPANP